MASGTAPEREKVASRPFLGARGRLQDRPESVRRASGSLPGGPWDAFGCCSVASVTPCMVETTLGSDFRRFSFVARKLRCAPRTTFYNVLLLLDEESAEWVGTATELEKAWFSVSKIEPGSVPATPNRAPAAKFERENAIAMRKNYKSRRKSQSSGQSGEKSASCQATQER